MHPRHGHRALLCAQSWVSQATPSPTSSAWLGTQTWLSAKQLSISADAHVLSQQGHQIHAPMLTPARHLLSSNAIAAAPLLFPSLSQGITSQPMHHQWPGGLHSTRQAHMHIAPRARLTQDADTLYIDEILCASTGQLESLALPVLRYCKQLNPRQTAVVLERLPRLIDWQLQHFGGLAPRALSPEQQELLGVLVGRLAARLADVAVDASTQDMARGLWGIGAACKRYDLSLHGGFINSSISRAFYACSARLMQRMQEQQQQQPPLTHLATTLWACAAAKPHIDVSTGDVRDLANAVAGLVVRLSPEEAFSSLDHRTIAKLACAFNAIGGQEYMRAGRVLSNAAAHLLRQQLQAYDPSTGPLQPRYLYRYRTVRNGIEEATTPKPPRPSKYIHDNSPTLISRDFEMSTLAPTLRALLGLNAMTPSLLDAAAHQLLASRLDSSSAIKPPPASSVKLDDTASPSRMGLGPKNKAHVRSSSKIAAQPPAALAVLHALLGAGMPLSPHMAAQLLVPVATGDRGHAPKTARTLRLAVSCGLPAAHPVVRLLLQQLTDCLAAAPSSLAPKAANSPAASPPATSKGASSAKSVEESEKGSKMRPAVLDASLIIQGAAGGFTWVHKRAGYRAKRDHLHSIREQLSQGAGDSKQQQVAQLSPCQAALTACAVIRSGAQGEGALAILESLVAQAISSPLAPKPRWLNATGRLSRLLPFGSSNAKSDQQLAAGMDAAKAGRAMARLVLALARATQRQQRLERFEVQRQQLVDALSAIPTLSGKDSLRVALGLASWRSPVPDNPEQQIQQQEQRCSEVCKWLLRAIDGHSSAAAFVTKQGMEEARERGEGSKGREGADGQGDAEKGEGMSGQQAGQKSTLEGRMDQELVEANKAKWPRVTAGAEAQKAEAAQEQERQRAAAVAMMREEDRRKAAASALALDLPVEQVRLLASAVRQSSSKHLPEYVMAVLQERAGYV